MAVPGILWALTTPFDPNMTEEVWNKWYTHKHIVDVVDSGLTTIGVRYKNKNPSAKWQYLAVYRLPDVNLIYDKATMSKQKTDSPMSPPGEGYMPDVATVEMIGYQPLDKSEMRIFQDGTPKVLVSVETEPTKGGEQDSGRYDVLSKEDGHVSATRYKSRGSIIPKDVEAYNADRGFLDARPADSDYLAVHEFSQVPAGLAGAKLKEGTDVWEYIAEYGKL